METKNTQQLRLTREELEIIREVSVYYRDIATHEESGIAGLKKDSKEFKLICSIMEKTGSKLLWWDKRQKQKEARNLI